MFRLSEAEGSCVCDVWLQFYGFSVFYGFRGRVIHDMHMCMCMHMHMSMLRNNAGERIESKRKGSRTHKPEDLV